MPKIGAYHNSKSVSDLSPAEVSTLDLAASGVSSREIAERLGVSFKTIENRLASIRDKFGVTSLREAIEIWKGRNAA